MRLSEIIKKIIIELSNEIKKEENMKLIKSDMHSVQ